MAKGDHIIFYDGYKYQLAQDYACITDVKPDHDIIEPFFKIETTGKVTARFGYAWDGPSGPTFDSKNFMRGSLVHDILYQAMGKELLSKIWRDTADKELRKICREDGMSAIRAWYVYRAVRAFGGNYGKPDPVHIAPACEEFIAAGC